MVSIRNNLTLEKVHAVARNEQKVNPLSPEVKELMNLSSQWVQEVINNEDTIVYGVNTGFGPLAIIPCVLLSELITGITAGLAQS